MEDVGIRYTSLHGDNFNAFTQGLKDYFKDYTVTHSKLPDQIDFAQKQQKIDLEAKAKKEAPETEEVSEESTEETTTEEA